MTTMIDTDTHVTEPADVWTSRMSEHRWGDLVPHVRWDEAGQAEAWFVGDRRIASAATSSFMIRDEHSDLPARWPEPYPAVPSTLAELHPASYDATARLKVMDAAGVWAAALFPNLNFVGQNMYAAVDDADFQLLCVQAYNDWLIEWASTDPRRLLPMACIPYFDVKLGVAEMERCAAAGHKGFVTTGAPHRRGEPFLADRHWDPFWATAQEIGLPIAFHAGGGDITAHINAERAAAEGSAAMIARSTTAILLDNGAQLADLLMSGVLPHFPELKVFNVESGIGFIPFVLQSCDYHFKQVRVDRQRPEFEMLPSEYFRRQVYANFWFEELDPYHIEQMGAQSLLYETDFPHSTCLAPQDVAATIERVFARIDPSTRDQVLWGNAAKLFGIAPPPVA
jgi:predicted TIM-barrel fold metal-dependent hydrolase